MKAFLQAAPLLGRAAEALVQLGRDEAKGPKTYRASVDKALKELDKLDRINWLLYETVRASKANAEPLGRLIWDKESQIIAVLLKLESEEEYESVRESLMETIEKSERRRRKRS